MSDDFSQHVNRWSTGKDKANGAVCVALWSEYIVGEMRLICSKAVCAQRFTS